MLPSVLVGFLIGLGNWIYLSTSDVYMGAILFSIALLYIRHTGLPLFTGMTQRVVRREASIEEYGYTLLGNFIGSALAALMFVAFSEKAFVRAQEVAQLKWACSLGTLAMKGVTCGILMTIATAPNIPIWISTVAVVAFITTGLEHCVADAMYVFIPYDGMNILRSMLLYAAIAAGNAVGGALPVFAGRGSNRQGTRDEEREKENADEDNGEGQGKVNKKADWKIERS